MAFQLVLMEARDAVDKLLRDARPTSPEAAMLIRIGLLNYTAGALLMPYDIFLAAARILAARHGSAVRAVRRVVRAGVQPAVDPAAAPARGACRSSFFASIRRATCRSASPPPAIRSPAMAGRAPGGSCTTRSPSPGAVQVQVAELPDGATYLCFARAVSRPAGKWGEPKPVHVIAMGCAVTHAEAVVSRTAWTWNNRKWGSGCPAGCAIGRTAAAGHFPRWSIGCPWIR